MLKYIAVLTMLIDHINLYVFDRQYEILTLIGRIAFPLFIYLSVKSYMFYTRSKENYIFRVLFFACLTFCLYPFYKDFLPLNILFSIFLGLVTIYILENEKYFYITIPFIFSLYCEYSFFGVLSFVAMYYFLLEKNLKTFIFLFLAFFLLNSPSESIMLLFSLSFILFDLYLKIDFKTNLNKYFFYWFYPFHLVFLGLLK
ncbi:TraX family protein [Sulfurospirillum sp. 1307]